MNIVRPKKNRETLSGFFRKYPVLFVLAAVTVMADTCYMTIIPLAPLYFRSYFQINHDILIGLAISAFVFSETVFKPFAGGLGDRIRRNYLIFFSLLIGAVTPYFLYRSETPAVFITIRFIDGMGAAIIWPSMIALFADITKEKDRATAMSVFTTCMVVSMGVGFTLSTFLKALFGSYNAVFTLMSILMGTALLTMIIFTRKINEKAYSNPDTDRRVDHAVPLRAALAGIMSNRDGITQLGVLVLIAFMQMLGTSILTPTTFLFLSDVLKWEEKEMWKGIIAIGGFLVLVAIPAGRIVDRIGKGLSLKIAMTVSSLCLGIMITVREPWTMGVAAAGYGIGFVFGAPAWMALVTRSEWANLRGTILGVVTAFQGAGAVIGPIIGTAIYNDYGPFSPFQACAAILGLCAIISIVFLKPLSSAGPNA